MANRRNLLLVGETFEFKIMTVLKSMFPTAIILHDLHVPSTYLDKETQIDVLAITDFGVFVIEAKNWKHWIKGDYDDFEWSGLTNERKVITVFNPFHQNFIHIRALRNAIRNTGETPLYFHNLVVLPDGTEIVSDCAEVVNLSRLPTIVQRLSSNEKIDKRKCEEQIKKVILKR